MGSTGRFHCGFAERGLKNWAKIPANTSQKRNGGVFEGQCAARIREGSMMTHALTQMDTQAEYLEEEEDCPLLEGTVGGSHFHILVEAESEGSRRTKIICTRVDSRKKAHRLQLLLPPSLLHHFKSIGRMGDMFEVRTEAVMDGVRYRSHPNYRGQGPWYDFIQVQFRDDEIALDNTIFPDDNMMYPAKLACFYRICDELNTQPFSVLAHCAAFQPLLSPIYKRKTLLTRSWYYKVTTTQDPKPVYTVVGTVTERDVIGHIFAIEETPGFQETYRTSISKRFIGNYLEEYILTFSRGPSFTYWTIRCSSLSKVPNTNKRKRS